MQGMPSNRDDGDPEPYEAFLNVGMLLVEGRLVGASGRGYSGGPHCPQWVMSASQIRHQCEKEEFLCGRAETLQKHMRLLWQHNVPMSVEVLLCPSCYHGTQRVQSGELAAGPNPSLVLIEQWIVSMAVSRVTDSYITVRSLLQAVHSYLHFSQLSAWLNLTRGKPLNILYRVSVPGEVFSNKFTRPPEEHNFPLAAVDRNSVIKVSVRSLPRSENIPNVPCVDACRVRGVPHTSRNSEISKQNMREETTRPESDLRRALVKSRLADNFTLHKSDSLDSMLGDSLLDPPQNLQKYPKRYQSPSRSGSPSLETPEHLMFGTPGRIEDRRSDNDSGIDRIWKKDQEQYCSCLRFLGTPGSGKHERDDTPFLDVSGCGHQRSNLGKQICYSWNYVPSVNDMQPCKNTSHGLYSGKGLQLDDDGAPFKLTKGEMKEVLAVLRQRSSTTVCRYWEEKNSRKSGGESVVDAANSKLGKMPSAECESELCYNVIEKDESNKASRLLDALIRTGQKQQEKNDADKIRSEVEAKTVTTRTPFFTASSEPIKTVSESKSEVMVPRQSPLKLADIPAPSLPDESPPLVQQALRDCDSAEVAVPSNDEITELITTPSLSDVKTSPSKTKDCIKQKAMKLYRESVVSQSASSPRKPVSMPSQLLKQLFKKEKVAAEIKREKVAEEDIKKSQTDEVLINQKTIPSASERAQFRRSFDSATSMVFHNRSGLPLTSSPAPLRRGKRFDFDSSLITVAAIKQALFEVDTEDSTEIEAQKKILSSSAPASVTSSSLLGNFEESVLNGRLEPVSTIEGFTAEIGASGAFCPKHTTLPVSVFFYTLGENDKISSPYLAHVNLGKKGYTVPRKGTIQVTLFNPLRTVVKMFVVVYDLTDMPPNSQTFLRQRTLYMPVGEDDQHPDSQKWLRYLIHLRFASSKSGRIYLHTDMRMIVFRKSDMDTAMLINLGMPYELRSFIRGPENPKFSPRK